MNGYATIVSNSEALGTRCYVVMMTGSLMRGMTLLGISVRLTFFVIAMSLNESSYSVLYFETFPSDVQHVFLS